VPAPADTPLPPRAHAPRYARTLLIGALGAGLAGLAVPGSPAATVVAAPPSPLVATAVVEPVLHGLPTPAPVAEAASAPARTPTRRVKRAQRAHRHVGPTWVRPVYAGVSSGYGPRWGRMHKGVDFNASYGARVRAVGAGRVIGAGYLASESGYGIIVLVRHEGGAVSAYAHLSKALVHAGEKVEAGEVIGRVGNTGHSFGAHLHFEIRIGGQQVNPLRWLRKRGVQV